MWLSEVSQVPNHRLNTPALLFLAEWLSRCTLSRLKCRQAWWRQRAVSSVDDTAANQKTNSRWKSCKAHKHRSLFAKHCAKPSSWLAAWSPLPKDQNTDTWPTQHGDNRVGLVWRHTWALCRHSHKLLVGLELCWRYGITQTHFDRIRMHLGSINTWRAAGCAGKFAYYKRAKSRSWQRWMCSPSAILVKFRFLKDISNRKFKRKFWLNIVGCFGNSSTEKKIFRVCDWAWPIWIFSDMGKKKKQHSLTTINC